MPELWRKRTSRAVVLVATCEVCGQPANWGFGGKWACGEHRQQIEAAWVSEGIGARVAEVVEPVAVEPAQRALF